MARQILGKVVPTGEDTYDNNRTYDELCIVMYNGQSYISKKETRGNKPDNTEYWQQLVEKPVKGTDYFTEADKDEIVNDVTNDATNKYNQAVKTGIETFNQNAERKTSDFNDNASEKTDTYNANADSTTQAFTNNANSKTEAYNTNATEKLGTYNSNHTAKLKEYNDNATSKLSAYNTNTVAKTTEYNSNHTDKLNAYNTNASNKVDTYNTNADTRLEEYNTNADNKIAEYDEHSKELNNKIVSIGNDYRMVKDQLLYTGEDTGTFIHVEDSAMAEMKEIKVDGVLQQNTTTGKNLLPNSAITSTINGISFKVNNDKSVILNGTATAQTDLLLLNKQLNLDGECTFSISDTGKTGVTMQYGVVGVGIMDTGTATTKYTTTFPNNSLGSEYSYINMCRVRVRNGVTCNNYTIYPMIERGSSKTSYEPYTGGQSPNPDFPQEIKTITDSLKITSTDSNIFDITNSIWKEQVGVSLVGQEQRNSITIKGTNGWGNIGYMFKNVRKNTNMVLSANFLDTVSNTSERKVGFTVYGSDNDNNTKNLVSISSKQETIDTNSAKRITCKFNSGSRDYIYIRFWNNLTVNALTNMSNLTISNIKLEFGDKETAYSELYSQITANLPEGEFIGKLDETYKDTLKTKYFPEEGQYHWMLDKIVAHKTFTGATDENWILQSTNQYGIANFQIVLTKLNVGKLKSNLFIQNNELIATTQKEGIFFAPPQTLFVRLKSNRCDTVSSFRQWLSEHNLELYYILNTPYTLDLGVIDMPMSYKDITNIFTDSDLLPTINAKYYRVFDKTIQNAQINEKTLKQEITDLNATVSALDTRLKALETKTVEKPTESEGTV